MYAKMFAYLESMFFAFTMKFKNDSLKIITKSFYRQGDEINSNSYSNPIRLS